MFRNPIPFKFATFFLSVFIMMGGWAHADEFSESEFFEESNGTEDSPGYSFENEKSFKERNNFFDSNLNDLKITDSRTYTSSPRKRERLRDSQNRLNFDRDYFYGIFSDIAYTATSPLRWDDSDWMTAAWIAGGTSLFFILDEEIRDGFEDNRSSTIDDVSEFFERFGNGAISLPALGSFLSLWILWRKCQGRADCFDCCGKFSRNRIVHNCIKGDGRSSSTFDRRLCNFFRWVHYRSWLFSFWTHLHRICYRYCHCE